jgi:hypothetical protein
MMLTCVHKQVISLDIVVHLIEKQSNLNKMTTSNEPIILVKRDSTDNASEPPSTEVVDRSV